MISLNFHPQNFQTTVSAIYYLPHWIKQVFKQLLTEHSKWPITSLYNTRSHDTIPQEFDIVRLVILVDLIFCGLESSDDFVGL